MKKARNFGSSEGKTAVRRRFIGWDQPTVPLAVEELFRQFAVGDAWDMRDVLIVLPSGLAKRRLQELLALRAIGAGGTRANREQRVATEDAGRKVMYPPQMVTVGQLPEELYVAKFPFASDMVQVLTWVAALQKTAPELLQRIVPQPPPLTASEQWLELGKLISTVHRELASDRLNFQAVAEVLGDHPEAPRWQALAEVQATYLGQLDGLGLWDIQTARLMALKYREPQTTKQILVVGAVDLNKTQRGFLEAVAEHVEIWVAAPPSHAGMFDAFGCLDSPQWQDAVLELSDDCLWVGNTPADQAELTAACLAELGDRFHTRDVTIGIPDATLVPTLQHQLSLCDVRARNGAGTPLSQSEPASLLSLIGKYVQQRNFSSFAALVRHPAIGNVLQAQRLGTQRLGTQRVTAPMATTERRGALGSQRLDLPPSWLAEFDHYCQEVLPKTIDDYVNEKVDGAHVYTLVTGAVTKWLSKLGARSMPLSHWAQPLLQVLKSAYEGQLCDLDAAADQPIYNAAKQLCELIVGLRDIPAELEPRMTAGELIDWLLRATSGKLVPEPSNETAIEMLGWLELSLDDAPVLILTGVHDGVVPESVNADAFLPNQLRRQLGMMDNGRRYARDMYCMQVVLHAREHLRIVVGKADHQGDPLVPSRLLLACGLEELPSRVLQLVSDDAIDVLPPTVQRWQAVKGASRLTVPAPIAGRVPATLSVTALRDYLACPYRFYLRHVLKLSEEVDSDLELDARKFGILLHDTLAMMGKNPVSQSTDPEEVEQFLVKQLQIVAADKFGPAPPAGVLIQIEQAEMRLRAFAPRQAQRAAAGWLIKFVEQGVDAQDHLRLGIGQDTLTLIGRIDRIDYHPAQNRWAIWDYKTSETANNPVSVHWSEKDGWKDLQLPMYRKIAAKLGVQGEPDLGYITLPKQVRDVAFVKAEFADTQLLQADALANETAAKIRRGEFWPDHLEVVHFDDYARICQSDVQRVSVAAPMRLVADRTAQVARRLAERLSSAIVREAQQLLAGHASGQLKSAAVKFEPLLIRASAGTGKTFQLSNRLLQIILSGQEVDHVLATTFTRKAAGEIMQRVLQRLAQACVNEAKRTELSTHIKGVDTSPAACLAALRRVTGQLHRFRVSTLDSFFAQIARTFSLEMMLPPGWSALDPVQEPAMQMQAVQEMLDSHDRKTLVNLVRMLAKGESQRQVAEQIVSTVRAGFGAYRVTKEEDWDQPPLPSPPTASAVTAALAAFNDPSITNKNVLRELDRLLSFAVCGEWEGVIQHGVYKNLDALTPTYYRTELPASYVAALNTLREAAAATLLPIRRAQTMASYEVLKAYDERYSSLVKRQRTLAFSDVSYLLSKWMLPSKVGGSVDPRQMQLRLDCGVSHLLLDEFQDTSPEQWRILQPLAGPLAGEADREHSFFCVGDSKQAIYGWRGGVAEIFDSVTSSLSSVKQSQLNDSFRSSPEVIEVVNEVFQNLPQHSNFADCDHVARAWSERFPKHRTSREDLKGYVRLQNGPAIDRNLTPDEKRYAFMQFTATQIADLTAKSGSSVGVLFRRNADVATMIALLRDRGIAASQDGGNPLTDSAAVELVLSLVHLADHPGDGICAFHVGSSPLVQYLPADPRSEPHTVANWFRAQVARFGLGRTVEMVANWLANDLSWWDQHRLKQLVRSAFEFQASGVSRLSDFERSVMDQRIALPTEAQVKVMTIHKSKGLEFDAVFLPDLAIEFAPMTPMLVLRGDNPTEPPSGVLRYMNEALQKTLPESWQSAFKQTKARGVYESLCLLYVAMTRARCALYLSTHPAGADQRQNFDSLLQSVLATNKDEAGKAEAVLFELGDPEWFSQLSTKEVAEAGPQESPSRRISLRSDAASAPPRSLRVAAPSTMGQTFEPVPLANAFSYSQCIGASFGTIIHAFFEQIRWLDDYQLDPVALRKVALTAVTPEELRHLNIDKLIESFGSMLQLRSVRQALGKQRYSRNMFGEVPDRVEIDNERVINLVMNDRLIAGTIDRLVVLLKDGRPYAAEIIDFKTDAYDDNMTLLWVQDRIDHHRPQLEIYARVVSELFDIPEERIATHLILLSGDEFVECRRAANVLGGRPVMGHLKLGLIPAYHDAPPP